MQRSKLTIETRLIDNLSLVHNGKAPGKSGEVKNAKEFQKFFNGFKRAMKFGLSARNVVEELSNFPWNFPR